MAIVNAEWCVVCDYPLTRCTCRKREAKEANDIQHGGTHYKKHEYQHWDFVCDNNLHYLLGCATKYVARWRDKNGVEDLQKAIHYLQKAKERNVIATKGKHWMKFASQFSEFSEGWIVVSILNNEYDDAIESIQAIISAEQARANRATSQSPLVK